MSVRVYAAHLGVSPAAVANWDSRGELARLNTETQQLLDIDLARASDDVQQRFAAAPADGGRGVSDGTTSEGSLDRSTAVTVEAEAASWHLLPASLNGVVFGVASALDLGGSDDVDLASAHVRRRTLLLGLAAVAAAGGIVGPGNGPRRRIGPADVSRLAALTSLYRLADQEFGGGSLVDDVGRFAQSASALLDHVVSDALRPQLLVAIASTRDLAGWTAFDATRHSDAQRHFAAAERLAIEAVDRQLVAHVRYGQAKQMQHLRHNRDARRHAPRRASCRCEA